MTELNEMVTAETLRNKIDARRNGIRKKCDVCKAAVKALVNAHDRLMTEEASGSKKPSKFAVLENRYAVAREEMISFLAQYDSHVSQVNELYEEYLKILDGRASRKLHNEAVKFAKNQSIVREKLLAPLESFMPLELLYPSEPKEVKKEPVKKEEPKPQQPRQAESIHDEPRQATYIPHIQPPPYFHYAPQGVNIAPMSIDISAIVEDAVSAAMNKFKAAFEKRADAYIDDIKPEPIQKEEETEPLPNSAVSEGAEKILKLEENILEDECAIIEKLAKLTESLNALSAQITELGAAYIEIDNRHKDAVEAQRRINDMQRTIAREIQGVQSNQKVINQDQAALSGEQAVIIEHQRANIENQKLIGEAQAAVSELQKNAADTQAAVEESMKEVIAAQKEIAAAQQAVISENKKNAESGRELSERQSDVTAMQKEVIAHQREVARSQKSVNAKIEAQKSKSEK